MDGGIPGKGAGGSSGVQPLHHTLDTYKRLRQTESALIMLFSAGY